LPHDERTAGEKPAARTVCLKATLRLAEDREEEATEIVRLPNNIR
jgi:hypothetical protein